MAKIFNGKMMAEARRDAGMDQAELARIVSRNRVTISDIERGKLRPGRELASAIAAALSLELDALYDSPAANKLAIALTGEELQVIYTMRRLGEVQRAKILAYAQGLAAGASPEGVAAAAELTEAIERASQAEQSRTDQRTGSA